MRQHKLWFQSSYDRGLDILLNMWPDIRAKFPLAELHCAYGWNTFDSITHNNPERQEWKKKMIELMKQDGVFEHGRLGKDQLKELRKQMGILAYPTYFTEIFMIGAIEAQSDGLVPVTMNFAALKETVGSGIKVAGDIYDKETQDRYLMELLKVMGNEEYWQTQSKKAIKFAKDYSWEKISRTWAHEFRQPVKQDIKVSIITPTIRKGFFNIMAHNLSIQTYKNIEWIIVDDYDTDRSDIAKKYARMYDLDIKYVRGKERKIKRTYGLVNANNTGLNTATGELLVILQDFILIPQDGIEQLVTLHKKHPDALLAPVDIYVAPKVKPDTTSEDWFNGNLDVVGKFMRQNIRIQGLGVRLSEWPYDFEQNYCAIPKRVAIDLGGWWEFMDEGLGFDNTEMAMRALRKGYKILVDETNIAVCIDHWEALKGTKEHGLGRERRLNDPRYIWEERMLDNGKLPMVRTQEIDDKIELLYTIPEEIKTEDAVKWMRAHTKEIVDKWDKEVKL